MIYLYGDSHALFSFKGLSLPHMDRHEKSITMHRIGRDHQIIHYHPSEQDESSVSCISYGEVDCRCHIHRQRLAGRDEDEIICQLVQDYLNTVHDVIRTGCAIIVIAIIPPTRQQDYETINGPITHEFPFVGSNEDRVRYTRKMNALLESKCQELGLFFINPYSSYTRDDGTLRYEDSDQLVHLQQNAMFLSEFIAFYHTVLQKKNLNKTE